MTGLVDGVAGGVPVVAPIIPQVAPITAPVVSTVDGIVEGVTEPVLGAVEPIVAPVVGVVTPVLPPVVDVVAPVIEPVVAPVVEVVDPVVAPVMDVATPEVAAPAPVPAPSPVAVPAPPIDAPEPMVAPTSGSGAADSDVVAPLAVSDVATGGTTVPRGPDLSDVRSAAGAAQSAVQARATAVVDIAVLPALASSVQTLHDFQDIALATGTFGGALSSMTGAGNAAPLAALGAVPFLFVLLLRGSARRDAAAGLPTAPSFDPGSSPD